MWIRRSGPSVRSGLVSFYPTRPFVFPILHSLLFMSESSFRVFLEYTHLNHLASNLHLEFKLSENSEWKQMEDRCSAMMND